MLENVSLSYLASHSHSKKKLLLQYQYTPPSSALMLWRAGVLISVALQVDRAVRQAAAIALKNTVRGKWSPDPEGKTPATFLPEHKATFRYVTQVGLPP